MMGIFIQFLFLLALTVSVRGNGSKASHLSNKREVLDICAESSITPVSCADEGILGLLPHPDDCRLFYQCAYGVPFCQHCPAGLHFNPKLLVCDDPEQAGCVIGADGTSIKPDLDSFPQKDESGGSGGNEIPERCVKNTVTPVSCAEVSSPDALLPHPDDCNLFYYCVSAESTPVCRQCPADLSFNPELHVCDEPEHAGCQVENTNEPALRVLFV